MNLVKIDNKSYDVIVVGITRNAEIVQSENAGATLGEGAEEALDPIGTRYTYDITFRRRSGHEKEYDELWEAVTKPYHAGIWVEVVYNQTTIRYEAKFSIAAQSLQRIDKRTGKVYWGEMTVSCIPTKAQVLPS